MCASCSDPAGNGAARRLRLGARAGLRAGAGPRRGFTLAELVAVMLILAVLAVTVLPKLTDSLALRNDAFHDQAISALRYAHQVATSHRRLVCASINGGTLSLSIAALNPASACSASLPGPDGQASYASNTVGATLGASPSGTLYFQPSGRVSSDGAGSTVTDWTITVTGSDTITVTGETGHVE